MNYLPEKKQIILNKELNELDKLVFRFIKIVEKYVDYCIISGYISILLGRSRATEDIDLFIKKIAKNEFLQLYKELDEKGFWCLNTDNPEQAYSYLEDGLAIRFAEKQTSIPNFELKFPKTDIEKETFQDFIFVILKQGMLKISSLERQIAFKKYYLLSDKDIEDAKHIEVVFKGKINYEKVNKLREIIKNIKN